MAAVFALAAQVVKSLFSIDGLNTAAFDLIVTAIHHLAHLDKLREVSGHRVLDEFIRRAAGACGKLLKAGFGFGLEVHYHSSQFRDAARNCQNDCCRVSWARAQKRQPGPAVAQAFCHTPRKTQRVARLGGDKLALAPGQYLVELAEGERQCFHSISSHKATFRCTSSFAINCAPSFMRAICAPATAFLPAVNSRPCSACTARRWRMLTPNWNRKA